MTGKRARRGIKGIILIVTFFTLGVGGGSSAAGAVLPAPAFNPTLSLTGDCQANKFDPVPDPSCTGEPPSYPPPPNGPAGKFAEPDAITVDQFGNEYVASYAGGDAAKGRVDVFDDEGRFLTEVSVPSPKSIGVDSEGQLYVFDTGGKVVRYPPTKYDPGVPQIQYGNAPVVVSTACTSGACFVGALAVDAQNDQLIVAQHGEISRYKAATADNELIETFTPPEIGFETDDLAVDSHSRRIFVSFCKDEAEKCGVKVVGADAPHDVLAEINGSTTPEGEFTANGARLGLAVDEETGQVFVSDLPASFKVYQYSEEYTYLSQLTSSEFLAPNNIQIAVSNGRQFGGGGDAFNRHYLFVPVVKNAGRALAFLPTTAGPPEIEEVAPGSIGETEAELTAQVFPNGDKTEYSFELTTQAAFEAEGFAGATVIGEGTIPGNALSTEVFANAGGLGSGQSYRFRVVAHNELGPAEEEGQNEATFTTYRDARIVGECPNKALRTGPSRRLPDCRAYELVTPADTSGRPPKGSLFTGNLFPQVLSSPDGSALYFRIEGGPLPGSNGIGGFQGGDPYVARRSASGWGSTLEGPSGAEATGSIPGSESVDQSYSFWTALFEGPAVVNGQATEYVRYPDGHLELIGRGDNGGTDPKAAGKLITEDGTHIVFESTIQLTEDAPPTGTRAVYDRTADEVTHVVSLLPNDETPLAGQNASYVGASKDGEGIAFEIAGTLYLRFHNQTTYEIGSGVEFAGISEGGGRIFYLEGGELLAFDTGTGEVVEFSSTGDVTPVNVATQGTRAYFVSPTVLGEQNPQGEEATAGKQNLYLSDEGQVAFIATVTDRDVEGEVPPLQTIPTDGLGLWTEIGATQPAKDPSRTNPSGSVLLFQSRANLTGYPAGEFPQVYRYDSAAGSLDCLSCIPTGEEATGGASLMTITFDPRTPPPLTLFGFVPNLNPAGNRVFFESTEALVSSDTDHRRDVYEWEGQGVGSCNQAAGCRYLISSGQSERDNFLYAQSTSGDDVFFSSGDALVGGDASGASIYDAKVGGGFAEAQEKICVADGCRPDVTPAPASPVSVAGDDGNLPKPCPKHKHKVKKNGKTRCVKNKKHHHKKKGAKKTRAGTNRGAGK